MVGWIILGVIIGLIVLIMLIPIGADIRYEEGIVRISAKAAGIRLQLIPKPKKKRGEDRRRDPRGQSRRHRGGIRGPEQGGGDIIIKCIFYVNNIM